MASPREKTEIYRRILEKDKIFPDEKTLKKQVAHSEDLEKDEDMSSKDVTAKPSTWLF